MRKTIRFSSARLGALALLTGVVMAALLVGTAGAAETHNNCATFDDNGNIVSVTPNCTQTVFAPVPPMSSPSANPCDPTDTGIFTLVTRQNVFHINVNGAGDLWITNTQNGTATFDSTSGGASGQGNWAAWFGGSFNNKNLVLHSTFNVTIHVANGQTVTSHETAHMMILPSGLPGVTFDKPTFSCGG